MKLFQYLFNRLERRKLRRNSASQAKDIVHILIIAPVRGQQQGNVKEILTSFAKLLSRGVWKLLSSPSKPDPSPSTASFS